MEFVDIYGVKGTPLLFPNMAIIIAFMSKLMQVSGEIDISVRLLMLR